MSKDVRLSPRPEQFTRRSRRHECFDSLNPCGGSSRPWLALCNSRCVALVRRLSLPARGDAAAAVRPAVAALAVSAHPVPPGSPASNTERDAVVARGHVATTSGRASPARLLHDAARNRCCTLG